MSCCHLMAFRGAFQALSPGRAHKFLGLYPAYLVGRSFTSKICVTEANAYQQQFLTVLRQQGAQQHSSGALGTTILSPSVLKRLGDQKKEASNF